MNSSSLNQIIPLGHEHRLPGASFTGRYLSDNFSDYNTVFFISRISDQLSQTRYNAINESNFDQIISDNNVHLILDTVPAIISQDGLGDPPYVAQVDRIQKAHPNSRYVHISSTSVYPPGEVRANESDLPLMDENTPAEPDTNRGMARLSLEQRILSLYPHARIIRSGGLYGPGRCTALRFRRGDFRRTGNENRMISRIHVHDLCRLVLALGSDSGNLPSLVNGVDERPATNRETFEFIEQTISIEIPGGWRNAPPEGRRIVSLYARELLGSVYTYPTYCEGFLQCLADETICNS
jgi:nucleoside-diphosphate-sugar epimerase